MNAKDAYQNTLWNKLPYDLKNFIFVATEQGEFSVVVKLTERDDKDEIAKWISYLRSLDYEVCTNAFVPTQDEKYFLIDWSHYGKREKV